MRYADLHNHNHSRAYLWLKPHEDKHRRKQQYSPWTIISSNLKAEAKGRRAASYSQCDLVKLWNGRVKLTFNSLYPIERGFFKSGKKASKGSNQFLREIIRVATSHHLPIRDVMQMVYMKIPDAMIDFVQSSKYDYWDWLQDEYQFITSENGKHVRNKIFTPGLLRQIFENRENRRLLYPDSLDATGIYTIPRNRQELIDLLGKDQITMILTIEGLHAIGTDSAPFSTYIKRFDAVKKTWGLPIFFVTYAHHFDNFLCGHARSFPDLGKWFLNQDARKDGEFTTEGRAVIRKLLSIDTENNHDPAEGYRILIDVKHMSAASRKQYYDEIVNPCFEKGDVIPVIASHCGYSGIKTLNEHIEACRKGKEVDDYFDPTGTYNAWNINMCDEDVQMIFKTKGLFGLSFDQRILGVPKSQKNEGGRNTIEALWTNIRGILEVVYSQASLTDKEKLTMWDRISIGTDYEGYIDPINRYNTALDFRLFREDLTDAIDSERNQTDSAKCLKILKSRADVEAMVEKLCFTNAQQFVKTNYPE